MIFISLIHVEIKRVIKSLIYILFLVIVILFSLVQYNDEYLDDLTAASSAKASNTFHPFILPNSSMTSFGTIQEEIPEQIMPSVISTLLYEYRNNEYTTYPYGVVKRLRLSDEQQVRIEDVINEVTGMDVNTLIAQYDSWRIDNSSLQPDGVTYVLHEDATYSDAIPILINYEEFLNLMNELNTMLGGMSSYNHASFSLLSQREMTQKEALAQYHETVEQDGVTGSYARLFCDYMAVLIGAFSAFIPVTIMSSDRKSNTAETIYMHQISSWKILYARFIACLFCILAPILVLSILYTIPLAIFASSFSITIDYLGFIKYVLAWLLPTTMIAVSIGMFCTVATDTPIGAGILFVWSIIELKSSSLSNKVGSYGLSLLIRHNMLGGRQYMVSGIGELWANRIAYAVLSFILLVACVFIYNMKRCGKYVTLSSRKHTDTDEVPDSITS